MTCNQRPTSMLTAVLIAVVAALSLALPTRADAWGERQAIRSCGANWVSSWAIPGGGRANTQRIRGNCSGQLQAGVRASNGYTKWGPQDATYAVAMFAGHWVGGSHRGCYSCAASLT